MNRKDYGLIGETVYSEKLNNGLSVFVVPKHGYHKYFAYFATNYGGVDRRFRQNGDWVDTPQGVAHFLEHKMFDMTDGDAMIKLSSNGASPNAYTSADITAYHFDCVDRFIENLDTLLSFVSTPYFMAESVEKEQGIIAQEILMSEDDPDYCLYYGLLKSLFKSNPIRDSVAGTVESISEITSETLYKCHSVFYAPSNMALCIAGNVDPQEVVDAALRLLPDLPGQIPQRDYGPPEAPEPVSTVISKEMDVSLPIFLAGCKTSPVVHGSAALRYELVGALSLEILAGHSSPLYFRLYDEGLVSNDFSASFDSVAGAAYSVFGGETRDPNRVFNEAIKELGKISKNGPDSGLFSRIKKAAIGSNIRMLNSFDAICSSLVGGFFHGYDALEAHEQLSSITEDEITSFLRENLIPDNMAVSTILPKR